MNTPDTRPELFRYVISTAEENTRRPENYGVQTVERVPVKELITSEFAIYIYPKREYRIPKVFLSNPLHQKQVERITRWLESPRVFIEGDSRAVYKLFPRLQDTKFRGNEVTKAIGAANMLAINFEKMGDAVIAEKLQNIYRFALDEYHGAGKRTPYMKMANTEEKMNVVDAVEDLLVQGLQILSPKSIYPV